MTQEPTARALVIISPPSYVIAAYKIISSSQVSSVFAMARNKGFLVYEGKLEKRNNKYIAASPLQLLDTSKALLEELKNTRLNDAKPKVQIKQIENTATIHISVTDDLQCPYCSKCPTTRYGLSNHIRSKHPDYYGEFQECQKSGKK